jgi:FkbM family methyltransferase
MSIESYLSELSKTYTPNTLLDIGAHHGSFSRFCKGIWKDLDILMLEGNENCDSFLEKLPFPHSIVLLSDTNKEVTLHLNPNNPTCTGTSYLKEVTKNYINSIQVKKNTYTLDEVADEVNKTFDVIKIDTQGSELDIIRGGLETVKKSSYVIMEVSVVQYNENGPLFDEVVEYMNQIGFSNYKIVEEHKWMNKVEETFPYGTVIQVDVVFWKD